jgi:hypothetical protein
VNAAIDITNKRFGNWRVIRRVQSTKHGDSRWECVCLDCSSFATTRGTLLRAGHYMRCLTCQPFQPKLRHFTRAQLQLRFHGDARPGRKTKEYFAWASMRQRCTNPRHRKYRYYGGRGIQICDRWLESYKHFLADVGRAPTRHHSIDRIDNDGNYEPGNVRWATIDVQRANQRPSIQGSL